MSKIFFILIVILLVFLSIGTSLQFGLNGDDWQALYFLKITFNNIYSFFDIKNYSSGVSNYVFAHILMGVINHFFGYNPFPYYFISMILRIIAAISFYPAVHTAFKNKLAAVLSSVFFASMFAGIETTNWVFNMNTYISIALFNLFTYYYFSSDFAPLSKKGIITSIVLGLSFIITQNRMHGLLFIIPVLAWIKMKKINKTNLKKLCQFTILLFLPILSYRFITRSSNDLAYKDTVIQTLYHSGQFLKRLFSSIGNSLIPDNYYQLLGLGEKQKILIFVLFIILTVLFFNRIKKIKHHFNFVLLYLLIPPAFLIAPLLLFDSIRPLSSDQRYLIIPGAYLMVILATIASLLWSSSNQIKKGLAIFLIACVLFLNTSSLNSYFRSLAQNGRLATDTEKHFRYLNSQIEEVNNQAPVAILFISDNSSYLYHSITFGLTYHLMLTNPNFSIDFQRSPFPADNLESLIDVLSGPQSSELNRYGYKNVQIPLENVYVFTLKNKQLTNITNETKDHLRRTLPHLQ